MRLIFLGPPGGGKGTQADFISTKYEIPKLSSGDLLREGVAKETKLGNEAKQYMDQGLLVPDSVVIGLVEEKLASSECQKGFILDGFPRTVIQADKLCNFMESKGNKVDHVVYFSISNKEIVKRIAGRRTCQQCKAVYHLEYVPPKKQGICDSCGNQLIQRNDDKPETIYARLGVYQEQTAPLIEYYKNKSILRELKGTGSVPDVQCRLLDILCRTKAG